MRTRDLGRLLPRYPSRTSHRARTFIFPAGHRETAMSSTFFWASQSSNVCSWFSLILYSSIETFIPIMRAACWTCRNRTIQCDRTSTPCAKCEKAGLECFDKRPIRWVKGMAIRGKMRGQMLGGDIKAFDKQQQLSSPYTKSVVINVTPSFALKDPRIHDLDWSSRFYLDYCGFKARFISLYCEALI